MAIRWVQLAVLSFGLAGWSGHAAAMDSNAPVALATNVVAQRIVGDVIQTLLAAAPAEQPVPSSGSGSNAAWALAAQRARASGVALITNTFAGFVPGSLAGAIWAGFHTNGRSTNMWEFWQLPAGWPTNPPVLRWNTNNLMWGRKGMTAISQVCEGMGAFGQGAITALTRRHGYVRGHGMGPSGLHPERVGRRIWFCTRDNQVIERKVQVTLVRAPDKGSPGDYSIILFDADLPPDDRADARGGPGRRCSGNTCTFGDPSHKPLFMALQGGFVSAGVPGWTVPYPRRGFRRADHVAAARRAGLFRGSHHFPAQRPDAGGHGHAQPPGRPGPAQISNAMGQPGRLSRLLTWPAW